MRLDNFPGLKKLPTPHALGYALVLHDRGWVGAGTLVHGPREQSGEVPEDGFPSSLCFPDDGLGDVVTDGYRVVRLSGGYTHRPYASG